MKKLFPAVLVLLSVAVFLQTSRAEEKQSPDQKLLTAIDVVSSLRNGAAEADMIDRLIEQKGVEKSSPFMKDMDNEHKIIFLLSLPETPEKKLDKGKTGAHMSAGNAFFKKGEFDKAATEYSLAAKFAPYDYAVYRARGDNYLDYLKANLATYQEVSGGESGKNLFEKQRRLVCSAVYSDYRTTSRLIYASISDGLTEQERLRTRKMELQKKTDPNLAYKVRATENINSMRELRRLQYRQATAKGAANRLKDAMDEYRNACPAEEVERAAAIRKERDRTREAKWVKCGTIGDDTFFYDPSSMVKAKDGITVRTRKENTEDLKSHDLVRIRLNCGNRTYVTLGTAIYGADGKLVLERDFPKTETRKAAQGSPEEALLGKVCR